MDGSEVVERRAPQPARRAELSAATRPCSIGRQSRHCQRSLALCLVRLFAAAGFVQPARALAEADRRHGVSHRLPHAERLRPDV